MTPRQKKFAEYFAQSGNATAAAISAGYAEKYANKNVCKLMKLPEVVGYIESINRAGERGRVLSAIERQTILSDIARSDKYSVSERIRAIDVLNKMTGEYITKIQGIVNTVYNPFEDLTTEELRALAYNEE